MSRLFTPQERGVILFLIGCIIFGTVIYVYKLKHPYFAPEIKLGEEVEFETTIDEANESDKVNINTATLEELIKLPYIGEYKAKKIIEYREKYGRFEKIEDIIKVKGIGPKTFEKIKEKIKV